jgi:integrase
MKNAAALAEPPRVEDDEVEPLSADDIQRVIKCALGRRNGVRYVIALALGTRQGETIGLKWSRLDDETHALRIRTQLQRRTWEHGCPDPHVCGERLHKIKPCPDGCKRHTRPCPPPCGPDCTRHASRCPLRKGGGLVEADVKSIAGRRGIVLPGRLYEFLVEHRAAQAAERLAAGTVWEEGGWMFTQPNGRPLDPRRDYGEWQDLLVEAGVREARLHDARHTAATVLMLLGVPQGGAMDVMGWSNSGMAKRYQHPTNELRKDIADRVGGFLWGSGSAES